MNVNEGKNKKIKGVKFETLMRLFAILSLLLLVFMGINLHTVITDYRSLVREFDVHMNSHDYVNQLQNGSDEMTEQSRLFVTTKNPQCMQKYFEIVDNDIRENARKDLIKCFPDKGYEESIKNLNAALKASNALMDYEIHSMKLMVQVLDIDESDVPDAVKAYSLPKEEEGWDNDRKQDYASELVFGKKYRNDKKQIDSDIDAAVDAISAKMEKDTASSISVTGNLIDRMALLCSLLVILLIAIFVFVRLSVLRPLKKYVQCIKENRYFDLVGSYELKYLAQMYNKIFKTNMENNAQMNYMLEHDALTDVYSRLAFEEQKKYLSNKATPIALMVMDIDNFKNINDTYGHEEGDKALIRVAHTIGRQLRSDDIVARIGGDEFTVVMMNAASFSIEVIGEKIDKINELLMNPEDGSPVLSVSAGIAFSESGYTDELFEQADQALYEAKAAGRSGYKLYEAN